MIKMKLTGGSMKRVTFLAMALVMLVGPAFGADKIDPVGNEYIRQMNSAMTRYSYSSNSFNMYLQQRNVAEVQKELASMTTQSERVDFLKLDCLKYYKGNFPPAFSTEWGKLMNQWTDLIKVKKD